MSGTSRVLVAALVRIVLLAVAVWFVVVPDALGPDASVVSRIALVILALVLSIVVGEVVMMRMHMGLLVGALRERVQTGGGADAAVLADVAEAVASKRSVHADGSAADRAVPILIRALESAEPGARTVAHEHLKRLTGQALPAEAEAWRNWWESSARGGRG